MPKQTYDNIGQLKTAKGKEADTTSRSHEQFGYAYDAAWSLNYRTNNALAQSFGVNGLNQLTNLTRSGTYTVAGAVSLTPTNVTLKDNANSPQSAALYDDNSFARTNITLLNGNNTFQAVAKDNLGRVDTNTVTAYLPTSPVCSYDSRGNLTNDGRRVFYYDSENQLTNVHVVGAWKSEFGYDGLMRRKVRKEFTWSGSAWVQTNEVRYVYDGRLVIEERHYTPHGSTLIPLTTVTYTRGNDLSGTFEGAGGIGGLLARSDNLLFAIGDPSATALYHSDGNGNVTALMGTNGFILARYSYDPYGNTLGMSGPLAERNLYRFSSKEHHPNSGLVYYLYRYYEPGLQRWINRDPIGEEGGINLYEFVFNDPSNRQDPFGESCSWEELESARVGARLAQRDYHALLAAKAELERRVARIPPTAPRIGSLYNLGNIFERLALKRELDKINQQLPAARAAAAAAAARYAQLARAAAVGESLGILGRTAIPTGIAAGYGALWYGATREGIANNYCTNPNLEGM
jgi:RHS repeat-associated protein